MERGEGGGGTKVGGIRFLICKSTLGPLQPGRWELGSEQWGPRGLHSLQPSGALARAAWARAKHSSFYSSARAGHLNFPGKALRGPETLQSTALPASKAPFCPTPRACPRPESCDPSRRLLPLCDPNLERKAARKRPPYWVTATGSGCKNHEPHRNPHSGSRAQPGKPLGRRPPRHLHRARQRRSSTPPRGFPPTLCPPPPAQPAGSLCLLGASDPRAWAYAYRGVHAFVCTCARLGVQGAC